MKEFNSDGTLHGTVVGCGAGSQYYEATTMPTIRSKVTANRLVYSSSPQFTRDSQGKVTLKSRNHSKPPFSRRSRHRLLVTMVLLGPAALLMRYSGRKPQIGTTPTAATSMVVSKRRSWEVYRVAVAAFYALCIQKGADTCIEFFRLHPMKLQNGQLLPVIDTGQAITLFQTTGFFIWVSLYFIYNVDLYYSIDDRVGSRRIRVHAILTISLLIFYFFGATLGHPDRGQLGYILAILALDALYPAVLGAALTKNARRAWIARGCLQTVLISFVYITQTSGALAQWGWSAAFAFLMVVQLVAVAPLEARLRAEKAA